MNIKTAKKIQTILLVVTCLLFLWGFGTAVNKGEERAHNGEKIKIEMTQAIPVSGENDYGNFIYRINMNYKITNNAKTEVDSINVTTTVKDKDGKLIIQFTNQFGGFGPTGLQLKKGESVTIDTYLEERDLISNADFTVFYESDFSELEIINEVTSARFDDGYDYYGYSN